MIKHNRYIFKILFVVTLLNLFASRTAEAFSDDFTINPIGGPNWNILNDSALNFTNPGISMASFDSRSYPYMTTSNSVDFSSDKYFEVVFQYTDLSDWGVGIAFTDVIPPYPSNMPNISDYLSNSIIYAWGSSLHVISSICPNTSSICPEARWVIYPNNPPEPENFSQIVPDLNIHKLSIEKYNLGGNLYEYRTYLDSKELSISKPTPRIIKSLWIGNPNFLSNSSDWASLKVYSVSTSPTLPVHSSPFPYLSQKDPLWGGIEYDSASSWAGTEKKGIERWGCALTSVAMILQKYEVKTPGGDTAIDVTPEILNTWLKGQPDGYIGPGLINWIAVTRYAKESYLADRAPKELEYERSYSPSTPTLPTIIGVPGHFVVAHAEDADNWMINDPADEQKVTLDKDATVKSFNRFVQSETDLSYMLFVTNPGVTPTLKNEAGTVVPITWTDEYLTDDIEVGESPKLRVGMIPKPTNGKYRLETTNDLNIAGELKVYLYDNLAQVTPQTFALSGTKNVFEINYSKEPAGSRTTTEIDVTPPPVPTLLSPADNAHVNTNGLVLDWSDVTDPSTPVTYKYKSSWPGGSYGPVSTGTNTHINAPGTPDQKYLWQVQACDSIGNCSEWSSRTLTVDSTAPTADIVFPTPGPSSNYFEVVYSELVDPVEATSGANYFLSNWPGAGGSGDLLGDATITYNPASRTARIIFTKPGWYISPEQLWGVQNVHDLAGNMLQVSPHTEYSTVVTAPVLTSAATVTPNPTNQITQTWSWLSATDVGSGVQGYSTRTYDVVSQQYLSDWLWIGQVLGTSTSLSEGSWKLSLRATDNAGNVSSALDSNTLVVDRTVPTSPSNLHFDNPSVSCGGFTKDRLITIDWDDSTDNTQVAGYEYNIDYPLGDSRGSWMTFFTSSSYRGSLNEGAHYIKIRAKDTAGNYSLWSNSCAITYDPVKPTVQLRAWGSTINGTSFDTTSGVDKVEIKIVKPDISESTVKATGTTNWTYTMADAPYGNYKIYVTASDIAGNKSEELYKEFVMSPPSQDRSAQDTGGAVQGASTQNIVEPKALVTQKYVVPEITEDEPIDTQNDDQILEPEELEQGEVLGETTMEKKNNYWWWLLLVIPAAILIAFSKRKK